MTQFPNHTPVRSNSPKTPNQIGFVRPPSDEGLFKQEPNLQDESVVVFVDEETSEYMTFTISNDKLEKVQD